MMYDEGQNGLPDLEVNHELMMYQLKALYTVEHKEDVRMWDNLTKE